VEHTKKIIRIDPVPKFFSITWMLGSRCNYDCMYCPSELHDSTSYPHNLDVLKQTWQNIYNNTKDKRLLYKISFTGGEVTANKNFLPLIKWLRSEFKDIAMILLTSNGSASLNYYYKLASMVESIGFSTHSEFMDEKAFFKKSIAINHVMVRPKKSFHVNIMNEHWNSDRIKLYQDLLDQHNISHSINEIDYAVGTRNYIMKKGKSNLEHII
jgi:MoaA/NifB/PqqE/SkfB family radical SAM enzyme